jgi:hypothetical protein
MISPNPVCAELGVLMGDFSKLIVEKLNPKKLYLIDPWKVGHDKNGSETYSQTLNFLSTAYSTDDHLSTVQNIFSQEINEGTVSIVRKFSYDAADSFNDKYFDFVYIDSCHLYECVIEDLLKYAPKVKENGLICGHDYFEYDNFGVIKAVDEFCESHNYEMVLLNISNNDNFDWAIKKK